jgi:Glycosyl hydrolases family 32 N-terminal domain
LNHPVRHRIPGCIVLAILLLVLCLALNGHAASTGDTSLLNALTSPIILKGDAHTAYRDPLLFYRNGTFYLFYSYVKEDESTHLVYWYVGLSTSRDLQHWSPTRILTAKDQNLNFSSPGSLTHDGNQWLLTMQTYPIVGFHRGDPIRFNDARSRLYLMRSSDLKHWSAPELIKVKGPDVSEKDMGKMIDPFLIEDKDHPEKWWCFYKQDNRIVSSTSRDLQNWTPTGLVAADGENPEVFVNGNEYVLVYAPVHGSDINGVEMRRSSDLMNWRDDGPKVTLGQKDWPWAETRLTAGYIVDMRKVPRVGKYVLVCHSMGPGKTRTDANVQANCSIVIAWSDDLKTWHWPGQS